MNRDRAIDGTTRGPTRGWLRLGPLIVAIAAVVSFAAHDGLMAALSATPVAGSPAISGHHAQAEPAGHDHPEGCSTTREAAPTQRVDEVEWADFDVAVALPAPFAVGSSLAPSAAMEPHERRPRRSDLQVWRV